MSRQSLNPAARARPPPDHRLSTGPDQAFPLAGRYPHHRVDNDDLSPTEAAQAIVSALGLPRS